MEGGEGLDDDLVAAAIRLGERRFVFLHVHREFRSVHVEDLVAGLAGDLLDGFNVNLFDHIRFPVGYMTMPPSTVRTCPGDVARFFGGEKQGRLGDVGGFPEESEGDGFLDLFFHVSLPVRWSCRFE